MKMRQGMNVAGEAEDEQEGGGCIYMRGDGEDACDRETRDKCDRGKGLCDREAGDECDTAGRGLGNAKGIN